MHFTLNDIHLESTTACSGKCFMCPHDELNRSGVMEFSLFKKIVDDAVILGCKTVTPFRICDPLLCKDLFLWLDYIKEKGLSVNIFTNADNLTRQIGERLLDYAGMIGITISFHGYDKESYESNMGLDFDKVRKNISYFASLNNDKIPMYIYYLSELTDDDGFKEFKSLWAENMQRYLGCDIFMDWAGKKRLRKTKLDLMKQYPEKYKRVPCDYMLHHLDVMYDGKVSLCCVDYQGEVIFGDLQYQTITEVFNGRLYQYYLKKHLQNDWSDLALCSECSMSIAVL